MIKENLYTGKDLIRSTNKTGVPGVFKSKGRYFATIGYKSEMIRLGSFKKFEDAVNARLEAERKYQRDYVRKDNKTGCAGVGFYKRTGKYQAYVFENKKKISLGYFTDINEAINARKNYEQKRG